MSEWSGRRVFLTGGEGFIGSHLVEALVREGAQVRVLAYYNAFGSWGWLQHASEEIEKRARFGMARRS